MLSYDIVIVGGGIAGLYSALRLSNQNKNILVIEKNAHWGGRLYTVKNTLNGTQIQYEAGGARFSERHVFLMDLIKYMGMKKELVKISNNKTPISKDLTYTTRDKIYEKYGLNPDISVSGIITEVLTLSSKFTDKYLKSLTFYQFAETVLDNRKLKFMSDFFGYKGELFILNSYDCIRMLRTDFNDKDQFYVLKGGVSKLCNKIVEKLETHGVDLFKSTKLIDYNYSKGLFILKTSMGEIHTNRLILAIDKLSLLNLKNMLRIKPVLDAVTPNPLHRIYAVYPKNKDGKVWFDGIGKITTNNPLQYIIPIDEKKGLIMITYTDSYNADYWRDVYNTGRIKETIRTHLNSLFPEFDIPDPIYIKSHYWNNGVYYYKPGYDSDIISNLVLKPFKTQRLHIVGECYSQSQAWMEGALKSVNNMLKYY